MAIRRGARTFRRIVHPTDFSPASRPAFRKALELAKGSRAQLTVVHVLPVLPIAPDGYIAPRTYNDLLRGQREGAQKQLDRLVSQARAAGVRTLGILLDLGVASERIARVAKSRRADVIVMGTHGRTGIRRALMGSVAARVLTLASCPVLTVHA
jgi:nucleotide-binding universal stress UspA family protein